MMSIRALTAIRLNACWIGTWLDSEGIDDLNVSNRAVNDF